MTSDTTLPTRPVTDGEGVLRTKFPESIAGQSEAMDRLAQQLITLAQALEGLAGSLGLPDGLQGRGALSKRFA